MRTNAAQLTKSSNLVRGRCVFAAACGVLAAGPALADISGFSSGSGWSSTGSPPPSPTFTATSVTLTNTGIENYAGSVFFNAPHAVGLGFSAQFTYQQTATANPSHPGDGIAFVVQNSPAGATALGASGGAVGYIGITSSLAVVLDLEQGVPRRSTTGLGTGGSYNDGSGFACAPVLPESGHPIRVNLTYNAGTNQLSQTLTDLTTNDTFSHTYSGINLNTLLGGSNAWVGFTGSTGQNDNTQVISNFTLTAALAPINWIASGNGSWFAPVNWSPNLIPTSAHTVNIANGGTCTIGPGDTGQAAVLNLRGGSTLDLAGSTLASGGQVRIGESGGSGQLIVRNDGAVNASSILVSADASTPGTLRIGTGAAPGSVNAPVSGVGPGEVRLNHNSGSYALSQPLTGSLSVVHEAGTTTLSSTGTNYAGSTTVSGGTLRITNNVTFNSPINIAAAGAVVMDIAQDVRLNGNLSGTGPVTVAGNVRTARVAGNNSAYAGAFSLPSGTRGMMWSGVNAGSAAASWDLNGQFAMIETPSGANIYLGALSGSNPATQLATFAGTGMKELVVGGLGTSTTFAGQIKDISTFGGGGSGIITLNKMGAGTLTLSNNNTYTGGTVVNQGVLNVNGSIGLATVAPPGTLGGNGSINGFMWVQSGATLAPGSAGPGRISTTGLVQLEGTLRIDISGPASATQYDQILNSAAGGTIGATGNLAFGALSGTFSATDKLFIVNNTGSGALNGVFAGLADGGDAGTPVPALSNLGGFAEWRIYYHANADTSSLTGGNDIALAPADEAAPCTGDVTGDGVVDLGDLTVLLGHFGTLNGATLADGDVEPDGGDGDVDLGDLTTLLSNFGISCE